MDIKMIVFDLDDTLLRNDKTVSERTTRALLKCRDKGIKIVYATGRGQSAQQIVSPDLFDGYSQMCGAVAYIGENPVYRKLISTVYVRELLLAADKVKMQIAVELEDAHYSNFNFPEEWGPDFQDRFFITDFNTLDIEAEKIWAMPKNETELELLIKHLPKGLRLTTSRHDNFTMILHEDSSKANAVAALANHWGINSTEIVAFGDDIIDICMLQYCGTGVAMENAVDELKAVADYICDTNENDGAAKWIEEYVLGDCKPSS